MLISDVLATGLRRGGLDEANSTYKDHARVYLNAVIKEIESGTWWWKFKTGSITTTKTLVLTSVSGTYQAGETITDGQATPFSATVHSISGSTLYVKSENSVTPTGTVTGGTSSATGTFSSIGTTRLYTVGTDVLNLLAAFNETGKDPLRIENSRFAQRRDIDFSQSSSPAVVYPWGMDSNGDLQIGLYPEDSTTAETISFQYYGYTTDFTSSDDTSSLDSYIHQTVQPALYFGVARHIKQQEGDDEGAIIEEAEFQKVMMRARDNNINIMGDQVVQMGLPAMVSSSSRYRPSDGSL